MYELCTWLVKWPDIMIREPLKAAYISHVYFLNSLNKISCCIWKG